MFRKIILSSLLVFVILFVDAQQSKFTLQRFYDDFNDSSAVNWKISNTTDNLYLLENGFYELNRRNEQTLDLVYCKWENSYDNFEISMNFTFGENNNKEQYTGLIIKADKKSALFSELNQKGQFRMRKFEEGKISYLSGKPENEGWVKFKGIKGDNNILTVQSDSEVYAIFVNDIKVFSQSTRGLLPGKIGIVVGKETKLKIDNLGVYTEEKRMNPVPVVPTTVVTPPVRKDTVSINTSTKYEKTDTLKAAKATQNTATKPDKTKLNANEAVLVELQKKNEELQVQLNQFRNKMYKEMDRADSLQAILDNDGKRDYREENKRLLKEQKEVMKTNDSLIILLRTYSDVRAILYKNEGTEITLKLTEKLRQQKEANEALEQRIKELEVQNKKLTLHEQNLEAEINELKSASPKKK